MRFLFQPAEEYIADSGALHMKEDPLVKAITRMIAIHIHLWDVWGGCVLGGGGETSNVIPETARLMGTCRTFSPTLRERFP